MDIEVREFQAPKLVINYEELKAELEKNLEAYKGLVVTEETLPGSKAAQKELASLRVKIDTYRKEKKKEVEAPIKQFEAQCKELVSLVESVEKPIKDGIKEFDDRKRDEKRKKAVELAQEVAAAAGLNEKYAAKLNILDKYTNLTATAKAVKEDLETRAFALKVEQDREAERLSIIKSVLDSENERLKTKLSIDLFQRDINSGTDTSIIIDAIKKQANVVYEAENKPVEPQKEEQPTNTPPAEEKAVNEAQTQPQEATAAQQYKAVYEVVGDYDTLHKVSDFLKANGITYSVTSTVRV